MSLMSRPLSNSPVRTSTLLTLAAALLALLLLSLASSGGGSAQKAEAWGSGNTGIAAAGHAQSGGTHIPAFAEVPDAEAASPVGFEYLNALALGMFLVSLGLLLGAGFAGRAANRRLLELMRLPAVLPLLPHRPPLSALEVFRL